MLAHKASEALEAELTQLARSLLSTKARVTTTMMFNQHSSSHNFTASFLLDIAHCFKNRILQCWGTPFLGSGTPKILVDSLPSQHSLLLAVEDGEGQSDMIASTSSGSGALQDMSRSSRDSRIPFPRSSGGK